MENFSHFQSFFHLLELSSFFPITNSPSYFQLVDVLKVIGIYRSAFALHFQIDFQTIFWATPVLDFVFFFYQVANDEVVSNRRSEILQVYTEVLQATLQNCGTKRVLTKQDVEAEFLHAAALDLLFTMYSTPSRVYDWNQEDFDEMQSDTNYKAMMGKVYQLPAYRDFLLREFQRIEKTGVFEIE